MAIWVISTLWLLWIVLLWICAYRFLLNYLFSILWGRSRVAGSYGSLIFIEEPLPLLFTDFHRLRRLGLRSELEKCFSDFGFHTPVKLKLPLPPSPPFKVMGTCVRNKANLIKWVYFKSGKLFALYLFSYHLHHWVVWQTLAWSNLHPKSWVSLSSCPGLEQPLGAHLGDALPSR